MKAFPLKGTQGSIVNRTEDEYGMDLRDYFAAKAMQAIMANDTLLMDCSAYKDDHSEIRIAAYAYKHADAMMKVRKK